jgi:hypothetical protein
VRRCWGLKGWWLPFAALLSGGCMVPVNIDSVPPGAQVFFDGREIGVTPYRASLGVTSPWISVKAPGHAIESVEWEANALSSTFRFNLKRSDNMMQGPSGTGSASSIPSVVPGGSGEL